MSNEYYNASGSPGSGASGASAPIRGEFSNIAAGFALLPVLAANAGRVVVVNPSNTGLTVTTGALALAGDFATTGAFNTTFVQTATVTLGLPAVNGMLATLAGTETLSNKTLVAPALGTPASGVATNLTGTAAGLTAGSVTTNANLTGVITSVGNATSIASQTGTGTKFVMDAGPTISAPIITGNGVAVTQAPSNNSTRISTTEYTDAAMATRLALAGGTMTGNLTLGTSAELIFTGAAGTVRASAYQTGGVARWLQGLSTAAEGGANAGSDWILQAFDDAGIFLGNAIQVTRATQVLSLSQTPLFTTATTSDSSTKGATTAYVQAQFSTNRTLGDPGTATFGSGGVIKKSGSSSTTGVVGGDAITFATPFPNAITDVEITRSSGGSVATQAVAMSHSNRSVSGFIVQALRTTTDAPFSTGFTWEAWGY